MSEDLYDLRVQQLAECTRAMRIAATELRAMTMIDDRNKVVLLRIADDLMEVRANAPHESEDDDTRDKLKKALLALADWGKQYEKLEEEKAVLLERVNHLDFDLTIAKSVNHDLQTEVQMLQAKLDEIADEPFNNPVDK